ncbi:MAG: hypothetical protein KF760_22300 [Candidatus Eremiobacteraeota bacterium]|nr:hypothetical protein [Candidatus Eremiobacteraeota bacterium]MCW5866442.1 hypothetical protein [Candidatus Eremiobacteraeota bacterium]
MWLSLIAYTIRLGVKLGLVKTEPESAQSRAYIRSHDGLHWLRSQLLNSRLTCVEETLLRFSNKGRQYTIRFQEGKLSLEPPRQGARSAIALTFDPQAVDELELGPQSFVIFSYARNQLSIQLQAGDGSLGEVGVSKVELHLRIDLDKQGLADCF